jgi:hypothetical protein
MVGNLPGKQSTGNGKKERRKLKGKKKKTLTPWGSMVVLKTVVILVSRILSVTEHSVSMAATKFA